jgi:hypothetical protein
MSYIPHHQAPYAWHGCLLQARRLLLLHGMSYRLMSYPNSVLLLRLNHMHYDRSLLNSLYILILLYVLTRLWDIRSLRLCLHRHELFHRLRPLLRRYDTSYIPHCQEPYALHDRLLQAHRFLLLHGKRRNPLMYPIEVLPLRLNHMHYDRSLLNSLNILILLYALTRLQDTRWLRLRHRQYVPFRRCCPSQRRHDTYCILHRQQPYVLYGCLLQARRLLLSHGMIRNPLLCPTAVS